MKMLAISNCNYLFILDDFIDDWNLSEEKDICIIPNHMCFQAQKYSIHDFEWIFSLNSAEAVPIASCLTHCLKHMVKFPVSHGFSKRGKHVRPSIRHFKKYLVLCSYFFLWFLNSWSTWELYSGCIIHKNIHSL